MNIRKRKISMDEKVKPCEIPDSDEYNCLVCPYFNECQMADITAIKAELELDDDY